MPDLYAHSACSIESHLHIVNGRKRTERSFLVADLNAVQVTTTTAGGCPMIYANRM